MKQRSEMRGAECFALPTIASPCYGLASLSFKPYVPHRWQDNNLHMTSSAEHWSTQYLQQLTGSKQLATTKKEGSGSTTPTLPKDPRLWSREDVATWLQLVVAQHSLPLVQLDRFLMNGKALCLMSIEMFVKRVPLGGKLLYKDFQLRLTSALYS